jgi:hypothetical protein
MGDSIQLTSTFKVVGKGVAVAAQSYDPPEIKVSLPEIKIPDITLPPPVFSPQFSPTFSPQITLDPEYKIVVEPTPLHSHNHVTVPPAQVEVVNRMEFPDILPLVVEAKLVAPWKILAIVLAVQACLLFASIALLLYYFEMGLFN